MSTKIPSCVVCLYTVFIAYGGPQRFYAVNSDGSISNVSFTSPVVDVLQPNKEISLPPSCDSPLQCLPPQQNGTTTVYIPNEGNSGLILLEIEGEILHTYNITSPCVFNDFALLSNFNNNPLLIACRLTDNDSSIGYVLTDRYGTRDTTILRVPSVTATVSPIIVAIPRPDEGGAGHSVVSINTQNDIVTFEAVFADRDVISSNSFPCIPLRIQRHRLSSIFLMTCENNHSYLVNISMTVSFIGLPTSVISLANNARYTLAIALSNSTAALTIQEILSQPAATRTVQLNTTVILGADFGPDDKLAYVATNIGVTFINVAMALNGDKEFKYTMPSQLCSECPSVVFLNNNTVAISSSMSNQNILLEFFQLWPWPPQQLLNRTLNKLPRWYWFTPFEDFYLPNNPTDVADNNKLSVGITAAIAITCTVLVIILGTLALWLTWYRRTRLQTRTVHVNLSEPPRTNINRSIQTDFQNEVKAVEESQHAIPVESTTQVSEFNSQPKLILQTDV